MQRFKMFLAAAAASTLAAAALPAAAQSFHVGWGYGPPAPPAYQPVFDRGPPPAFGADLRAREDRLGGWIRASIDQGRIGRWQARRLFDDLHSVRDEEQAMRDRQYGRLYPDQAQRLNSRLDRIKDRLIGTNDYARYEPRPRW